MILPVTPGVAGPVVDMAATTGLTWARVGDLLVLQDSVAAVSSAARHIRLSSFAAPRRPDACTRSLDPGDFFRSIPTPP